LVRGGREQDREKFVSSILLLLLLLSLLLLLLFLFVVLLLLGKNLFTLDIVNKKESETTEFPAQKITHCLEL